MHCTSELADANIAQVSCVSSGLRTYIEILGSERGFFLATLCNHDFDSRTRQKPTNLQTDRPSANDAHIAIDYRAVGKGIRVDNHTLITI
jgi:hypothetical protein